MPSTPSSAVQISTTLSWLEAQSLIETSRVGGARRIVLLSDDGSGNPYIHPGRERVGYLKLPFDYWLDRWHSSLTLPATAVLLIGLSLPREFRLPQKHGAHWYGVSRDTIQRGISTLQAMGLVSYRVVKKKAPLAPSGIAKDRIYTLTGPFEIQPR
jgi:DNA-binding PadR family transcriptional regulator